MNHIELTGRISQDVQLHTTSNDHVVTTINLAVQSDYVKKGEEPTVEFIPVTVWGKLAETCANNLCKGYFVAVEGRLQRRSYTTEEGEKRYVTEAIADRVEFIAKPKAKAETEDIEKNAPKSKGKKASK